MYCGDETGAFIGDVGSHTARFGYGGEDCPKVVVPSAAYSHNYDGSRTKGETTRGNVRRGKYSAPVSLMRVPPDDCFSESGGVGFVPIYQSLNANNQKNYPGGRGADDGLIQDIDAWASLWEYSYQSLCVRGKGKHVMGHKYQPEPDLQPEGAAPSPSRKISSQPNANVPIDHPLLAVDSTSRSIPAKAQEKQRAKMLEAMFESLSAPAAYIAPSPMLSSFAYGRQTSLVVDVGHTGTRVTPLVDGYCLNSGSVSSGRGGMWLGNVQKSVLTGVWGVNGVVNNWNGWGKSSGGPGAPPCRDEGVLPRYLLPKNRPEDKLDMLKRSSFHSMTTHEVMYEMMTSPHVLPLDASGERSTPFCGYGDSGEHVDNDVEMEEDNGDDDVDEEAYVLPDGTRVDMSASKAGKDLRRLPELLFSDELPSFAQPPSNGSGNRSDDMLSLPKLIHKSLTQILDIDMRKELSSNIIVTGSASLFPGLEKRLSAELAEVLPSSNKYKVIASKNRIENRYSAWIGGSILSSLGSFQQLWLSKKEYEECGPVLALQRFKN